MPFKLPPRKGAKAAESSQLEKPDLTTATPDQTKVILFNYFSTATRDTRKLIIGNLSQKAKEKKLNLWLHLPTAGIVCDQLEEITPNELGHFGRFLKLNYPTLWKFVLEVLKETDKDFEKLMGG